MEEEDKQREAKITEDKRFKMESIMAETNVRILLPSCTR
jgi:hypothetical protein